jgi:hypothetical protein
MSVKLSELTASTGITSDDLFLTTNDPGGTPQSRKATAQQVLDYITGSTFNTLTVTNLTGTNSELTGVFSGTFLGDGSALTGIIIPVDNFTLGSTNIILGTTASVIQGLSVITGSTVTGSTALFDNITSSVALFTGDIRVLGTASITQLNTVGQQSLVVGDKYITILSGGVDHTGINGAGFLWGTSSGPGETTGALGEHAHILYDSSRDALEIFPGLYVTGSTTLFGVSGTIAQFTTISASSANVSGSLVIDGPVNLAQFPDYAYVLYTASFDKIVVYPGLYVSGNLTGSGLGAFQTVSGSTGLFTTLTGSTITGSTALFTTLTGSIVTGSTGLFTTITASNLFISSSGNTIIDVSSNSSALRITQRGTGESIRIEDLTNPDVTPFVVDNNGNVGIGTSLPTQKLEVNGSILIAGPSSKLIAGFGSSNIATISFGATENTGLSSPVANSIAAITSGSERLRITTDGNIGIGKQIPNSLLDIAGNTLISGNLNVTGTLSGTIARFTTISGSTISASNYVGLPTSSGGTPGGTNQTVQFNSGSTFSGSTNLVYNFTTNTLSGTTAQFTNLTSSVVSASTYLGLPFANSTFTPVRTANLGPGGSNTRSLYTTYQNTTGRTLFVTISISSPGGYTAFIYVDSDFSVVNGQIGAPVFNATYPPYASAMNIIAFVPPGHYYRATGNLPSFTLNDWYEYQLFGGGGDVILSASNTFTGINTFNTNFITASAGITGSIAQFTSITGSTYFSASNPSYWSGSAPINIQDAINRVAAAIFSGITGSIA